MTSPKGEALPISSPKVICCYCADECGIFSPWCSECGRKYFTEPGIDLDRIAPTSESE